MLIRRLVSSSLHEVHQISFCFGYSYVGFPVFSGYPAVTSCLWYEGLKVRTFCFHTGHELNQVHFDPD